jgi:hypothetical protein
MDFISMSHRSEKLPIPVRRALLKLGGDIRNARLRRRIQVGTLAERASMARATLHKLERGDPGVAVGLYATVLFVLGMLNRFSEIAEAAHDQVGLDLEEEHLPQRIRHSKPGKKSTAGQT